MNTVESSLEQVLAHTAEVIVNLELAHRDLSQHAARVEAELANKVLELDATNRRLAAILAALPTGVLVRSSEGMIETCNASACDLLGADAESLLGTSGPLLLRELQEGTLSIDARTLVVRGARVQNGDGQCIATVQTLDDQTELLAAERRLLQQSRLAALGTLAGGIAHEVRNPMNAIRGFGSLLAKELAADSRLARWADLIVEGADEVEEIVAATMRLARTGRFVCEQRSARALVEEACNMALGTRQEHRRQSWSITCTGPDATVAVDPIEMRQALRNLLVNALDAQPAGGLVTVRIEVQESRTVLHIEDAGNGVAPELVQRIREPFFTTRAEGTGLGLALVHSIAELHGGALELDSANSSLGGAHFRLIIPHRS